jgi:hypothetical protein
MKTLTKGEPAKATPHRLVFNTPEERNLHITLATRIRVLWCCLMHNAPMWPIHESYRCRTCGCTYPVPWAAVSGVQPVGLPLRQMGPILQTGAYPTKDFGKRSRTIMMDLKITPASFPQNIHGRLVTVQSLSLTSCATCDVSATPKGTPRSAENA